MHILCVVECKSERRMNQVKLSGQEWKVGNTEIFNNKTRRILSNTVDDHVKDGRPGAV